MNWFLQLEGGPARGNLELRRAPFYLRVVKDANGLLDGLDQPGDRAEPTEAVYVYRKVPGSEGVLHIRGMRVAGSRKLACAWYRTCKYRPCPDPPGDDVLRDEQLWRAWATERFNKEKAHAESVAPPGPRSAGDAGGDRSGGAARAGDDPDRGRQDDGGRGADRPLR